MHRDDRVVFVTGGAGDICSSQTRALVHLGADACIIGRNVSKTESVAKEIAKVRQGAKVLGIGGVDVRSVGKNPRLDCGLWDSTPAQFESLQKAVDRCVSELGAIDFVMYVGFLASLVQKRDRHSPIDESDVGILCTEIQFLSAGAAGNFVAPLSRLSPNAFKAVMDIDTLGTFNTVKATIPHLVESAARNKNRPPSPRGAATGGRILAVSATFHYTGTPLQSHVSAAKAGVDSILTSVCLEYGPLGVTSNVIAPGPTAGTEGAARLGSSLVSQRDREAGTPSGRLGSVRDVADATVYLFSDAGSYVNGHVLVVDGASWRRAGDALKVGIDPHMKYPDYLVQGVFSENLKDGRKIPKEKL